MLPYRRQPSANIQTGLSRRRVLQGLSATLGTGIAACGRTETPLDELVFALAGTPTNLDPRFAQDAFSDRITRLIFSTLLRRDLRGATVPHLARRVESPDDRTWVCRLRTDAMFHDGRPVVAKDVEATYRSILDPAVGSVRRLSLEPIEDIETPDAHTVIFRLRRPHAPFPQTLAGLGIAPARGLRQYGADFREHLVGSDAFRLVEEAPDSHVLLEANPRWFGGTPGVRRIRFRIIPDATVRVLEVLHGSADMTQNDLPAHVLPRLREEAQLSVTSSQSSLVKYLAFNLRHPHLKDQRVRAAIAHAIDREPIIRHKLRGTGSAASSFLHPDHWGFAPDAPKYAHDPHRARQLLEAAGLPARGDKPRLRLVYRTSTDSTSVAVARILRRQLGEVGIEMELRTNEWGVFFSDIKQGLYDLFTLSAVGVTDPDWYAYVFDSRRMPPNGANRTFYSNPEVDRLIEAGRATADESLRAPIYQRLQHITAAELPLLPLWYSHNVVVAGRNVHGYQAVPDGDFGALVATRKEGPR